MMRMKMRMSMREGERSMDGTCRLRIGLIGNWIELEIK